MAYGQSQESNLGKNPPKSRIIAAVKNFPNPLQDLGLPSAPLPFIKYFEEPDRPQTRLDRDYGRGMGVTMGRLMEDTGGFDFRFISPPQHHPRCSRGAILMAELLVKKGIFPNFSIVIPDLIRDLFFRGLFSGFVVRYAIWGLLILIVHSIILFFGVRAEFPIFPSIMSAPK
jgi:hypothetical protein